ncbi:MAG: hypothetical protein HYW27_03520, partial [Candidatus Aenigmarchaeota archaeon]|nr:hypothetical protein [Candidatus Aenigmarchaeota archaeon]
MSKKFKTQDYFRYPKLGKRWRRPKGLQSKLRLKKGGSGMLVSIGYGTKASQRNTVNGVKYCMVSNENDLSSADAKAVMISSGVGAKKTAEIAARAKELGVRILNMKKVKRAGKVNKAKQKKSAEKKVDGKKETGGKEGDSKKEEQKTGEGKKGA